MRRTDHDGRLPEGWGRLKKALKGTLLTAALALPILAGSASAAVEGGQTIEAFIGTNLVGLYNYPTGEQVKLEVIRKGEVIGHATKTAVDTEDSPGFIEINHGGTEEGDCFDSALTPNISSGDTLRTEVLTGPTAGDVDSEVVRHIGVLFGRISVNTDRDTITVSGHAKSTNRAPINPRRDVLELRLNKAGANTWDSNDRKDLRVGIGRNLDDRGNFTRVLRVAHNDAVNWKRNPGEVALEWSILPAGEGLPPAIFVADKGPARAAGCPPLGPAAP